MTTSDTPTEPVSPKIVFLGQAGVGKSALAIRLSGDEFHETASTQGIQSHNLQIPGDDNKQPVIFELGSEKSRKEILSSLKEMDPTVALLLCSIEPVPFFYFLAPCGCKISAKRGKLPRRIQGFLGVEPIGN